MSSFEEQIHLLMARIFALVHACPAGKVTTYGWLAKAVGYPRGASMVGWIMHEAAQGVPAQRVINSKGELSGSWAFGDPGKMRQLLEEEGIIFSADERVDLKRYGWNPLLHLSDEELHQVLEAAPLPTMTPSRQLTSRLRTHPASPLRGSPEKS